jgi:hypothetical protein
MTPHGTCPTVLGQMQIGASGVPPQTEPFGQQIGFPVLSMPHGPWPLLVAVGQVQTPAATLQVSGLWQHTWFGAVPQAGFPEGHLQVPGIDGETSGTQVDPFGQQVGFPAMVHGAWPVLVAGEQTQVGRLSLLQTRSAVQQIAFPRLSVPQKGRLSAQRQMGGPFGLAGSGPQEVPFGQHLPLQTAPPLLMQTQIGAPKASLPQVWVVVSQQPVPQVT